MVGFNSNEASNSSSPELANESFIQEVMAELPGIPLSSMSDVLYPGILDGPYGCVAEADGDLWRADLLGPAILDIWD